jgi:tetratricopeptide (TPR) repeat protein
MRFYHVLVDRRGSFRQLTRRGDEARDRGAYARAARFYRRALALDPCRADIRVQLGNMLKELARHQQAEAAYRRALSQSPEDGDIHLQLAHLLKLTGRKQEAIAAYRDAHRLLADSSIPAAEIMALGVEGSAFTQLPPEEACEAHIREGDRLRDARDYAGAAEAYGAAVALAPARTDIRVQHGNMLKDAGRKPHATPTSISSSVIPSNCKAGGQRRSSAIAAPRNLRRSSSPRGASCSARESGPTRRTFSTRSCASAASRP